MGSKATVTVGVKEGGNLGQVVHVERTFHEIEPWCKRAGLGPRPSFVNMPRIDSIHIYPVKSCQGYSTPQARVTPHGLEYDRRWAIIDASSDDNDVLTQYEGCTELASIRTSIVKGDAGDDKDVTTTTNMYLELRHYSCETNPLRVLIRDKPDLNRRLVEPGPVSRTSMTGFAEDEGDEAAAWLEAVLNIEGEYGDSNPRLIVCPPGSFRCLRMDKKLGKLQGLGEVTGFADTSQITVASSRSFAALKEQLAINANGPSSSKDMKISRFRMNVIVDDVADDVGNGAAWVEDGWKTVQFIPSTSSVSSKATLSRPIKFRVNMVPPLTLPYYTTISYLTYPLLPTPYNSTTLVTLPCV